MGVPRQWDQQPEFRTTLPPTIRWTQATFRTGSLPHTFTICRSARASISARSGAHRWTRSWEAGPGAEYLPRSRDCLFDPTGVEQHRFRFQPAPEHRAGREPRAGQSIDERLDQSGGILPTCPIHLETLRGSSRIFADPVSSIGTWPSKNTGISPRVSACNSDSRCLTRLIIQTSSNRTQIWATCLPAISEGSRRLIKRVRHRWRQNSTSDAWRDFISPTRRCHHLEGGESEFRNAEHFAASPAPRRVREK